MTLNKIYPCIWFDNQAEEASQFYCSVFGESEILGKNSLVITLVINGQKFICLNGGPYFQINPSISFYTICETKDELVGAWNKLSEKGKVMMPLDKYDWSKLYGWVEDRYGVSWQLTLGRITELGQKITPALMFAGKLFGRAEEAIHYYISVMKNSSISNIYRYPDMEEPLKGKVVHSRFTLLGQKFIAMDSHQIHGVSFNEALSLTISCEDQNEIDYYWGKLIEGGEEGQCGWLKDKFSVSWQIVPSILSELMKEPEKSNRVTAAFMKMNKLDIKKLKEA
ncbi:MAG: hypothetical protein CVV24_02990 [Ignavibacteriae bacterium HGW-Ignavibacteriae-3]|nr:MAG: hypothetical protein CVV24_02990 [Ignavibacteriae bacterium HGW-Ignavibacteriae-3]